MECNKEFYIKLKHSDFVLDYSISKNELVIYEKTLKNNQIWMYKDGLFINLFLKALYSVNLEDLKNV
jgi:hypothetical protein